MTLGERIRELRVQRRMTLNQLGKRIGVSTPFLSDLEHDRRRTKRLPEIAVALGVQYEELRRLEGKLPEGLPEWLLAQPALVDLLMEIRANPRRRRTWKIGGEE